MVKAGERLGNYQVAAATDGSALKLGEGAGGITFRGKHVHLGVEVAIKVLVRRKNLLQKDREAFLAEARAAASLAHPQIARILDFGESEQQHPYYVMELCEGGSLEGYGRKSAASGDYAMIQWMFESAAALAYAHQKGILHRDIKPSNLLLARQDGMALVKLIDFGLADLMGQDEGGEQVIGTPHFAAPEQLRGMAQAASDVFSLGATFLWLLTGKHLSEGSVRNVISERLESTGYGSALASLPPTWKSLLGSMLEIDPGKRPVDGSELMRAVQTTFPQHPGLPVAWDNEGESLIPLGTVPLESQWQVRNGVDWSAIWSEGGPVNRGLHGETVQAVRKDNGGTYEVTRFTNPSESIAEIVDTQGNLIALHGSGLGLEDIILERGDNWRSIAWKSTSNDIDALSWVRRGQISPTSEILLALEPLAMALDSLKDGGIHGLEIHPSLLMVKLGPPLVFTLSPDLPIIEEADAPGNSSATLRGASGAELSALFASTIYQILSGRSPAPAAFANTRAYQAIPKLTEQSNRYLASAIAGNLEGSGCGDVVRGLAQEERLPGASLTSTLASRSTQAWRTNPSMSVIPSSHASASQSTPPINPTEIPKNETPPPLPAVAVAPPQTSTTPRITIGDIAKDSPLKPDALPQPSARSKSSDSRKTSSPAVWLIPVSILLLLSIACGAGWLAYKKIQTAKPTITQKQPTQTKPAETSVQSVKDPVAPPEENPPAKSPDATAPLSLVKVPGDAATLAEALQRCAPNGVIEVSGGSYKEALVLNRSVSIIAKSPIIIQASDAGASLMTIKGGIEVSLKNLQIKDSRRDASGAVDSSPPLILITDQSSISLDGCVIEGGMGSGVSIVGKSSATLTNCRVRNNRGSGISLSSGSKATVSLSEIRENGHSGIAAVNVGTMVDLQGGTTIAANNRNGLECSNGASVALTGVEMKDNLPMGIIVEGAGSSVKVGGATLLTNNGKYGAGVRNGGQLEITGSTVEKHDDNGLFVETGGQARVTESRFDSNGTYGLYVVGGESSQLTVNQSDVSGHLEAGVVIVGGKGSIRDSRFTNNGIAVAFGDGSSGDATGNTVKGTELGEAFVNESSGNVLIENNHQGN